ncbi:MAG: sodium/proline symporter PutP [archaeon]|nr:sodium/proline symporter PutP [archaeon]
MNDSTVYLAVVIVYFIIVVGIGYLYYKKSTNLSDYILGGRTLNPYVAALSAQASDMSGWLLLGLPGSIYLCGIGEAWIGIGLAIGSYFAWLLIAKRLRIYSEKAKNSLTLSEFFSNRFRDDKGYLRDISAIIILVFFTIYVASGFVGAGNAFMMIFPDFSYTTAMLIGAVVIVAYTFLGGFKAVCWTDFLQGMLMLVAIVVVPLAAMGYLGGWDSMMTQIDQLIAENALPEKFTNIMYSGGQPLTFIAIISSLAWGLGYFGMPHIVVRYTAIKNPNDLKISRRVATVWIVICLAFACFVGMVGAVYHPGLVGKAEAQTIFMIMATNLFAPVIAGVILAALLAAIMSTADSQLLVSASAISNDLYKRFKKGAGMSENKLMWLSRIVVIAIAIIGAIIALDQNSSIMDLVSYAWAGFGAAFGPVVILALFWKRTNTFGALAGMVVGFITIIVWNTCFVAGGIIGAGSYLVFDTGLYELVPGFIFATIAIIAVSLLTAEPSKEIIDEFDEVEAAMKQKD